MSDTLNGPTPPEPPPQVVKYPAVELLESLLVAARQGQIDTLGMVAINSAGATSVAWVGGRNGDLYVGCDMMQTRLMQMMLNPQGQSRILRPMG